MMQLSKWWLLLRLTEKSGVVILLVLLIGVIETGISITALGIVEGAANTALKVIAQNEAGTVQTLEQIERTQLVVGVFLILANLVGVALIGLIIYAFNKNISTNVARLTRALALMQKGRLEERVMISRPDEFGQIGAAFNRLADVN